MAHMSMPSMQLASPEQRVISLADQCVMCGLCLPHCPTYRISGNEAESPRGRIALARALANGTLDPAANPGAIQHLDQCLGCMSCERACPSEVEFGGLIAASRQLTRKQSRTTRRWLPALLSRPAWLRASVRVARGLRLRSWLLPLLRQTLPTAILARLLEELPTVNVSARTTPTSPRVRPAATRRSRIGMLTGCAASVFDRDTLAACRCVLEELGHEVIEPVDQGCCGAMALHAGDAERAQTLAQRMRAAFEHAGVECVVVSASGCYGSVRDLVFSGSGIAVEEINAFVARDAQLHRLEFAPLPRRAALHLPCTLVNVARAESAPKQLLRLIPELDIVDLPVQPRCCGAAGVYFLEHPAIATTLRAEKLDQCDELGPDLLLTANIGCQMHLGNGLRQRGSDIPVLHPMQLLARQLLPNATRQAANSPTIERTT